MCTVDKILIKGIRSFSPDNQFRIEFYKPLTLIVGSNGAGKTTIIECLRQATTGELPPNTRQGQGFIHDPKVAGETDVKAQIKLQFRTSTGQPITVVRSFQLTQKKSTMQFKTLDSTVSTVNKDTGQKQAMTYRCADLDKIVPSLMGVSKAVLENVIFVHQEESNWPLAEGRVLKDKFDDIFAATKYTRALEALRKLRTEKAAAIKEMKAQIETLRAVKNQATYHQRDRDVAEAQIGSIKKQIGELELNIKGLDAQRSEVADKLSLISEFSGALGPKRAQLELRKRQNAEKHQKLASSGATDFEESTEELLSFVANYSVTVADLRAQQATCQRALNAKRIDKEALTDKYSQECLRHGKLAGEAATHASNVSERDRFIRSTATALALPLPPEAGAASSGALALPASAAEAFASTLAAKVRELEANVRVLKADNRSKDATATQAVDSVTAQLTRAQEGLRIKRDQMRANTHTIDNHQMQISSMPVSASRCKEMADLAREADDRLKAKQADESSSGLEGAQAEQRAAVEGLARRISALRQEREMSVAANESGMRLRVKRADLAAKEEQIASLLGNRRQRLLSLLGLPAGGQLPEPSGLRAAAEAALAAQRREHEAKARSMREVQAQEQVERGKLESCRRELAQKEAEVGRMREQLRAGMASAAVASEAEAVEDSFNNSLAHVEKENVKVQTKLSDASAMLRVLNNFRSSAANEPCCPVCNRAFNNNERQDCVKYLDTQLLELPRMLSDREVKLAAIKAQLEGLRALQPLWHRYVDLAQSELPQLRRREAEARDKHEQLKSQSNDLAGLYAVEDMEVGEAAKLMGDVVWAADRMAQEAAGLRREIQMLEVGSVSQAARTVSDVDSDLEAAERAKAAHEAAKDDLARKSARLRDELVAAQRASMSAQKEAMDATLQLTKVVELQDKIRQLEAANAELAGELSAAQSSLAPLEEERRHMMERRDEARAAAGREEAAAEQRLREAQLASEQLASKARTVADYEARGRGAELARVAAELEELQRRMEANSRALLEAEAQLKTIEGQIAEQESLKRSVDEVVELRQSEEAAAALGREIQEISAQVEAVGDASALQQAAGLLVRDREALRSQVDQLKGHLAAQLQVKDKAERELRDERYAGIDARYKAERVKMSTTEMANNDLEKYYKALEKALLTFHTNKMADINKMIKELWQKTYRGQDIDYIQIRADTEGVGARSYNYRMVMYSGSAELEMRGRCSAGQKVLACLIIRLALAETFCLNCGILALDEPTTNLDAANSASLADGLRAIISSRASQENFQLIIITHDERFARAIGTHEYAETMWRVTKDVNQHTLVEPEDITDDS